MKTLLLTSVAASGVLLLAGCAGDQLSRAEKVRPTGSAFTQNLNDGYLRLSKSEFSQGDYSDSDYYARRAAQTAGGSTVAPESLEGRRLPASNSDELAQARNRLIAALNAGVAEQDPVNSAQAQVNFDCWMEQQEENRQPDHIAACRNGYMAAMDGLAPTLAVLTKPKAQPQPARYVVYFDTNKAVLSNAAMATIAEAKSAAEKVSGGIIKISGNADRVGNDKYNEMLSKARADAVAKLLATGPLPVKAVYTEANGEKQPAVMTPDGVAEPRNRRVEIVIEP